MKILSQWNLQIDSEMYKKVKIFNFNRSFGVRKDLEEKMGKYGFIGTTILISTKYYSKTNEDELYIADGQHRIETAISMGLVAKAIVYKVDDQTTEGELVQFVASLNTAQKPWIVKDYVKAHKTLGNRHYEILQEFYDRKGTYSHLTYAVILSGIYTRSRVTEDIKSGNFKVTQIEHALRVLAFASKIYREGGGKTFGSPHVTNRMLMALSYVMIRDDFNEETFKQYYLKWVGKLKLYKIDDYKDIFLRFNEGKDLSF
jgi:hypothetical protein